MSERGSASTLAVAMLGVLLLVGAALATVGVLVVRHRTAQSAADLAALAGAQGLARGEDGCAGAAAIAARNGASVTSCTVADRDVLVTVSVPGPDWLGISADLEGAARAGPDR